MLNRISRTNRVAPRFALVLVLPVFGVAACADDSGKVTRATVGEQSEALDVFNAIQDWLSRTASSLNFFDRQALRELLRGAVRLPSSTEEPNFRWDLQAGGKSYRDAADMIREYNPQLEQIAQSYGLNDPLRMTRVPASFSEDGQDFDMMLNGLGFALWKEAGVAQERRGLRTSVLGNELQFSTNGYTTRAMSQQLKKSILRINENFGESQRFSFGIGSVKAERVTPELISAINDANLRAQLTEALNTPKGQQLGHVPSRALARILDQGDPLASAHIMAATFAQYDEEIRAEQARITANPSLGRYPGYANFSVLAVPHDGVWGTSRLRRGRPARACENNIDDDGDGKIDEEDGGCRHSDDDSEGSEDRQCGNNIDDDGDGLKDDEDEHCESDDDDNESE